MGFEHPKRVGYGDRQLARTEPAYLPIEVHREVVGKLQRELDTMRNLNAGLAAKAEAAVAALDAMRAKAEASPAPVTEAAPVDPPEPVAKPQSAKRK